MNDSGTLFALKGKGVLPGGPDVPGGSDTPEVPGTPGEPDVPGNSGGSGNGSGGSGAAGGEGAKPAPGAPGVSFGGSAMAPLFGPARHVPLAQVAQGALARAASDSPEVRESDVQAYSAGAAPSNLARERAFAATDQSTAAQGTSPWSIALAVGFAGFAGAGALLVAARRKTLR